MVESQMYNEIYALSRDVQDIVVFAVKVWV